MLELDRLTPSAYSLRLNARVLQTHDKHESECLYCDQDLSPSTREYVAMSLSPRPERFTMMRSSAESSAPSLAGDFTREQIKTLKDLEPALRRGLDVVNKQRRPYLLDVTVAREGIGADATWYDDWEM